MLQQSEKSKPLIFMEHSQRKSTSLKTAFILGFAYDSLKCAKIIQAILDYIEAPETEKTNPKKNFSELTDSVSAFTKKVSKINSVDNEVASEILKELVTLEDQLTEAYTEIFAIKCN